MSSFVKLDFVRNKIKKFRTSWELLTDEKYNRPNFLAKLSILLLFESLLRKKDKKFLTFFWDFLMWSEWRSINPQAIIFIEIEIIGANSFFY